MAEIDSNMRKELLNLYPKYILNEYNVIVDEAQFDLLFTINSELLASSSNNDSIIMNITVIEPSFNNIDDTRISLLETILINQIIIQKNLKVFF